MKLQHRALIIGIGNAYRRDDAVGLVITQRLREKHLKDFTVMEESSEGTALMEAWKGAETVILIDAVQSGAKPGTIHRLDAQTQPIPAQFFRYSTHAFSAAEAIELARMLNQLPPRLIVYGIEGKNFESGEGLSPEAGKAAERVLAIILQEIEC